MIRAAALCALGAGLLSTPAAETALAQGRELQPRARQLDANGNGVVDRGEARGPLAENFDTMDCDRSGGLDGAEIRGFFSGAGCPQASPPRAGGPQAGPGQAGSGQAGPGQAAPARRPGGRPPRPVRVDEVVVEPLSRTDPVIGRLVARRAGRVAAFVNGAVARVDVEVGDRVRRGDVMVVLHRGTLAALRDKSAAVLATRRAMAMAAEAELLKKEREHQRMEGLSGSSSFSRARFEDLGRDLQARRMVLEERRAQVQGAEADLGRADIDLANAEIRAPYDGVVSERHTEVGSYVGVGAPVVSLINDREIEVEAEVPSDRVAALGPGTGVRLQLDDGTWLRAVVRAVVPSEDLRTRTRPVRFTPDFGGGAGGAGRLAVNQSVTVMVPVGAARDVVTVHKDAVVHRDSGTVVFLERGGRAFPRPVSLGEAAGDRYVVLAGVGAGDRVITHGNEGLPPGSAVRVVADRLAPAEGAGR